MTAVVDSHFCQVEASGIAANMAILFQDAYIERASDASTETPRQGPRGQPPKSQCEVES